MAFSSSSSLLILLLVSAMIAGSASASSGARLLQQVNKCDKCNLAVSQGGCKCNTNCDCITTTVNKCDKCNLAVSQGGCKCNTNCDCITTTVNKCDKCNLAVSQGGCKCDVNCDCLTTTPPPTPGNIIHSSSGRGTYYYDLNQGCPQDSFPYAENSGYPTCTSWQGAAKTLAQYGTNNIVAIDNRLLAGNGRAQYCGKKVVVYKNGVKVTPPNGGDFVVWDGCQACADSGDTILDFSVSGLKNVDSNACQLGVVPGIKWDIYDTQVIQFVP